MGIVYSFLHTDAGEEKESQLESTYDCKARPIPTNAGKEMGYYSRK